MGASCALITTEGAKQAVQRIARALGRRIELLDARDDALRLAREGTLFIVEGDETLSGRPFPSCGDFSARTPIC